MVGKDCSSLPLFFFGGKRREVLGDLFLFNSVFICICKSCYISQSGIQITYVLALLG